MLHQWSFRLKRPSVPTPRSRLQYQHASKSHNHSHRTTKRDAPSCAPSQQPKEHLEKTATAKTSEPEKLIGIEAPKSRLRAGHTVTRRERGNSMTPRIRSGELIEYHPTTSASCILKGDVVWCKVGGRHYTHVVKRKVWDGGEEGAWRFLIGNMKGGINGWIGMEEIFGKAVRAGGRAL